MEDVNDLLGTHLEREFADTLGGFIAAEIGRVPTGGEQVAAEDWTFNVEQVAGRRIRRVRARRLPTPDINEEKKDDPKR